MGEFEILGHQMDQLRVENKRKQGRTMSMLEKSRDEVMQGNLKWQERPYKWRKDQNEKEMMQDYQQRYSIDESTKRGVMNSSQAQMGPFYQKYIKKMGQNFVKDRVKRLKETFEVARRGQINRFRKSQSLGGHQNILNSPIMSSTVNYEGKDTYGSEDDYKASTKNNQQAATSTIMISPPLLTEITPQNQQKNRAIRSTIHLKNAQNTQFFPSVAKVNSPLMRKSGFDLRQRLGRGDRTVDQIFSMDKLQKQDETTGGEVDLRLMTTKDIQHGYPMEDKFVNSVDTGNFQQAHQQIHINLPDSHRSPKDHNKDNREQNGRRESQTGQFHLQQNSIDSIINPSQEQLSQNDSQKSLKLVIQAMPQVSVVDNSKNSFGQRANSLYSPLGASKIGAREPAIMDSYMSQAQNLKSHHAIQKKLQYNQDLSQVQQQKKQLQQLQQHSIPQLSKKRETQSMKISKHNWRHKNIIKDKLPVNGYQLKSYRNTLQKHVWKQPSVQTDTGYQLVDETIKNFYEDAGQTHHKNETLTSKSQFYLKRERLPPVDLAVLKQKAFQEFDLIIDAEKDIQRTILTKDQIPFGKERETPKRQKRFQYSNINPKLVQAQRQENKRAASTLVGDDRYGSRLFQESRIDMPRESSQQTSDHLMDNSQFDSINYKQKSSMGKLCNSCIEPAFQENKQLSQYQGTYQSQANQSLFQSTRRSQDKQMEDWMRGNYHVKLKSNLLITQDFDIAADRTKQHFEQAIEHSNKMSQRPHQYVQNQQLKIESKLHKKLVDERHRPSSKQQNLASIDHIFQQAQLKRQLEGSSGVNSSEKLELVDSSSNILIENKNSLVYQDSISSQLIAIPLEQLANQITNDMNKNIAMAQGSMSLDNQIDSDDPGTVGLPVEKIIIHEQKLVNHINNIINTGNQTLETNQGPSASAQAGLYDVDGKISFLEPEISEKLEQARQYQQEIGILVDNNDKSPRRQQKAIKSSNFAGQKAKQAPLPIDQSEDPKSVMSESIKQQNKLPASRDEIDSHKKSGEFAFSNSQVDGMFDTGTLMQIKALNKKPDTTDQKVQATIISSDYMQANNVADPQLQSRDQHTSQMSDIETIQQLNQPMYDKFQQQLILERSGGFQYDHNRGRMNPFDNRQLAIDQMSDLSLLQRQVTENNKIPQHEQRKKFNLPAKKLNQRKAMVDQQNQSSIVVPQANAYRSKMTYEITAQTDDGNLTYRQGQASSNLSVGIQNSDQQYYQSIPVVEERKSMVIYQKHDKQNVRKWQSPYQAHVAKAQGKKQMLDFMVNCQPSELHKASDKSQKAETLSNMQNADYAQEKGVTTTLRMYETSPQLSYPNTQAIQSGKNSSMKLQTKSLKLRKEEKLPDKNSLHSSGMMVSKGNSSVTNRQTAVQQNLKREVDSTVQAKPSTSGTNFIQQRKEIKSWGLVSKSQLDDNFSEAQASKFASRNSNEDPKSLIGLQQRQNTPDILASHPQNLTLADKAQAYASQDKRDSGTFVSSSHDGYMMPQNRYTPNRLVNLLQSNDEAVEQNDQELKYQEYHHQQEEQEDKTDRRAESEVMQESAMPNIENPQIINVNQNAKY